MKLIKKICEMFYKKEYDANHCTRRILFLKIKTKLSDKDTALQSTNKTVKLYPPNIEKVGKNTYSAPNLRVCSPDTEIGSFCSIGLNVQLGHGIHPLSFLSSSPYFYFPEVEWKGKNTPEHREYWDLAPIKIGNDVWIGDNVFVKNGVKISDGAVVGANAVVTKDIPPYAIAVGNPAKVIRYRFDESTINRLLNLKWWELDDEILKNTPYDSIEKAIEYLESLKK